MSEGAIGQPATIYDVARRAGVSTATVSRVLRGTTSSSAETHARVLAAARDLSYRPMRRPRLVADRRREAFGMVLPDLDGPHYSELVLGLESASAELGQHVMLLVTRRRTDVAQAVRDLATHVDGLVIAQGTVPDGRRAVAGPHPAGGDAEPGPGAGLRRRGGRERRRRGPADLPPARARPAAPGVRR